MFFLIIVIVAILFPIGWGLICFVAGRNAEEYRSKWFYGLVVALPTLSLLGTLAEAINTGSFADIELMRWLAPLIAFAVSGGLYSLGYYHGERVWRRDKD